jgi:hypothetical protein
MEVVLAPSALAFSLLEVVLLAPSALLAALRSRRDSGDAT